MLTSPVLSGWRVQKVNLNSAANVMCIYEKKSQNYLNPPPSLSDVFSLRIMEILRNEYGYVKTYVTRAFTLT